MSDWWYWYYMDRYEQAEKTDEVIDDPDELRDDDRWYDVYIPNTKENKNDLS